METIELEMSIFLRNLPSSVDHLTDVASSNLSIIQTTFRNRQRFELQNHTSYQIIKNAEGIVISDILRPKATVKKRTYEDVEDSSNNNDVEKRNKSVSTTTQDILSSFPSRPAVKPVASFGLGAASASNPKLNLAKSTTTAKLQFALKPSLPSSSSSSLSGNKIVLGNQRLLSAKVAPTPKIVTSNSLRK